MRVKRTLLSVASRPRAARVLLTLVVLGLFALAADPAAADCGGGPPYDDPICD
jgi:hypothetical protein